MKTQDEIFFFLYDHLAKAMNEGLDEYIVDSDGLKKTRRKINGKTHY